MPTPGKCTSAGNENTKSVSLMAELVEFSKNTPLIIWPAKTLRRGMGKTFV